MTLKELPIGKTATVTVVGGEARTAPALSGYGHYPMGNGDHGEICTYG